MALPEALAHVEMRPYQREGLAWLAFLRRLGLHGVLADDMGLGKTLQTTAIIAGAPRCALVHVTMVVNVETTAKQLPQVKVPVVQQASVPGCMWKQLMQSPVPHTVAVEERRAAGAAQLPSLVVCPSTLVLHWAHEVAKFVAKGRATHCGLPGRPPGAQLNNLLCN